MWNSDHRGVLHWFFKKEFNSFYEPGHHDTKYSRLPDINRNVPTKSSCGTYFNLASDITTNRLLLKMKWIVVWKPKCNFLFLHRRIKPKLNGLKRCHQIPEEQWDINDRFLLENYWCHLRLHHRRYHYLHPPENAKKEHVNLGKNANFKSYNPGKYIKVYVFIYLQQHLARICVPD